MSQYFFDNKGFSPSSLSGQQLWLDASRTPTGAVASWQDFSGSGNNAIQNTSANRPMCTANLQNGRNGLIGNSTAIFMALTNNITLGTQFTIFTVCTPAATGSGYIFGSTVNSGGGPAFITEFSGKSYEFFGNTPRFSFNDTAMGANICTFMQNNGVSTLGLFNNNQIYNTLAASFSGGTINTLFASGAGSGFAAINFYEMLFYNRALSIAEITQVNRYLSNKWGIAIS